MSRLARNTLTLADMTTLVWMYTECGRKTEALELLNEVAKVRQSVLDMTHAEMLRIIEELALTLVDIARPSYCKR
jgi:hypothetical protein